ncbi:MAG: hypothetical protein OXC95_18685 [Dehalococcoidia bacterium]|nr:hypothetical protein [Dehalococcoidia bacterium]
MNELVRKTVQQSRSLITNSSSRTTKALARDKEGNAVNPLSKAATCWCAKGAVMKTAFELALHRANASLLSDLAIARLNSAAVRISGDPEKVASDINDSEGHSRTLDMFDAALTLPAQTAP